MGPAMPDIAYELIRSSRKTLSIQIMADARLVVRAPLRMPRREIDGFVLQKRRWIDEKQEMMRARVALHKPAEPASGEEFPILGRKLMLAVSERAKQIDVVGDTLAFPKAWLPKAEQRLRRWYCEQAAAILNERLARWRDLTGIHYGSVRLSDARKRWGSCSSKGSLNFSWRLVMAPVDVIDYVVVHELVHIEHMNHSKAFWARVGEIMPDYESRKKWLRDHSGLLRLF